MAGGCAGSVATLDPPAPGEPTRTIQVARRGWHTSIVVHRGDVDPRIWPEVEEFGDRSFVEVAWGDRDFYMAEPGTLWLALKAAFGPTGSVLHAVAFDAPVERYLPETEVVELRLSRRGFDAMTRFFHEEYARDPEGRIVRLGPGQYGHGFFYAARSRYSLLNTCNTWIVRALRAAGLPVTPAWAPTAGAVMLQVRRLAPVPAPGAPRP